MDTLACGKHAGLPAVPYGLSVTDLAHTSVSRNRPVLCDPEQNAGAECR